MKAIKRFLSLNEINLGIFTLKYSCKKFKW